MRFNAVFLALAAFAPLSSIAQRSPTETRQPLPITRITLFAGGVGYTERTGLVEGEATVPLVFRTAQVNDILKSMMLVDSAGKVQPAVYGARDPISHSLSSFAIDVTQNMTLQQLLEKLRGVEVEVAGERGRVRGRVLGVETRPAAGRTAPQVVVNLAGDRGVTSAAIRAGGDVRILDRRLERELQEALAMLATGNDEQRRTVNLRFSGQGSRAVRVGYVTEAPLWKMSYRLLLSGAGIQKPYLQGWALVENTSDEDWSGVRLSLVSGRPISFIQDLYQPLYLNRPIVAPDVVASPTPQLHAGDMLKDRANGEAEAPAGGLGGGGFGGGYGGAGRARRSAGRAESGPAGPPAAGEAMKALDVDNTQMVASVDAAASGQQAGELFRYDIKTPVNLPRRQAAMIPVVVGDIEATKVSLYNADSGSRYPLNAVRVKNTTGLHLKGGPITLFDEDTYAGDARMEDVPPGESRILSYAVDLGVEGERKSADGAVLELGLTLKRGVLVVSRRERRETVYNLKSRADKPRTVLVEHPLNPAYELVEPAKPEERTTDRYRFLLTVAPGASQELKVVEQRPISESVTVMDAAAEQVLAYSSRQGIPAKLKEALGKVVSERAAIRDLQAQAATRDEEIKATTADQDRVRQNMGQLDRNSDLYKRYVKQLDEQETRMQSLRTEVAALRKQADEKDRQLRAYLDTVTIE